MAPPRDTQAAIVPSSLASLSPRKPGMSRADFHASSRTAFKSPGISTAPKCAPLIANPILVATRRAPWRHRRKYRRALRYHYGYSEVAKPRFAWLFSTPPTAGDHEPLDTSHRFRAARRRHRSLRGRLAGIQPARIPHGKGNGEPLPIGSA